MSVSATEAEIAEVRRHIEADGLTPHESRGEERVVIGVVGDVGLRKEQVMGHLAGLPGVETIRFAAQDVVRHRLVGRIIEAYDADERSRRPDTRDA